jgi:hypothetical protein
MLQSLQPTNYLKFLKAQYTLSESQNKKDNMLKMQAAGRSKKSIYCDPYKKINPFGSIRRRLDPEETKKQKLRKQKLMKKKQVIDYFGSSVSSSTPRKRLNPNPLRKIKVQKHRAGKICVQKMEKAYSSSKKLTDPDEIQRKLVLQGTKNLIDQSLVPSTLELFSTSLAKDYQNFLELISPSKPNEKISTKDTPSSRNPKKAPQNPTSTTDPPIVLPTFQPVTINGEIKMLTLPPTTPLQEPRPIIAEYTVKQNIIELYNKYYAHELANLLLEKNGHEKIWLTNTDFKLLGKNTKHNVFTYVDKKFYAIHGIKWAGPRKPRVRKKRGEVRMAAGDRY